MFFHVLGITSLVTAAAIISEWYWGQVFIIWVLTVLGMAFVMDDRP